jgi:hypothetical protein
MKVTLPVPGNAGTTVNTHAQTGLACRNVRKYPDEAAMEASKPSNATEASQRFWQKAARLALSL